MHKQQK